MTKKTGIIIASVILLLMLIITVQYFQKKSLRKTNQVQAVELMAVNDSVKAYKDKLGNAYFMVNAVEIEKNALKVSLETMGFTIKELRQKDVTWRNVVSALKAKIEVSGQTDTIPLIDVPKDSLTVSLPVVDKGFDWTNHYLTISGIIKPETIIMNYKYTTDIALVQERERKGIKVTAIISDPTAKISTGSSIFVSQKLKWYEKPWLWGLGGLVAGYFATK